MKKEGTKWTDEDVAQLRKLTSDNTCTPCIAKQLERSVFSIRNKCSELGISLKPNDGKDCKKC